MSGHDELAPCRPASLRGRDERARDEHGRRGPSPRAVTRGESQQGGALAKVDWLNATFDRPALSPAGFVELLGKLLGRPTSGQEGRGMFGFESGVRLRAYVAGSMVDAGWLCYGGESQRGRWLLQLTGKGCGLVADWPALRELLESLDARVTRLDLAADFLEGEYSVDDAVRMHEDGGFTSRGRPPSTEVAGDWLEGLRGRTLYVGKGTNGKMLRVYEKGIQLGDLGSAWVRFEVQLGNRDREIPLDALTECDRFFAGCYPCLEQMVSEAAERIPTKRTEGEVSLSHLLHHLKRGFGKVLNAVLQTTDVSYTELIEELRITALPRRLNPSCVVAGAPWAGVQALLRKHL